MEYQKTLNILNEASDTKFVTRKWNIANDKSNVNYDVGMKLCITQKYENLIFMITMMLTF